MRLETSAEALGRVGLQHIVSLDDNNEISFAQDITSRKESTTQIYIRKYQTSGFMQPSEIGEGTTIPIDDIFTGNSKDYRPTKRALGFYISTEASESDQYGALSNIGKKLRGSFRRAREQSAANVINNATSSSYTGPDGKALAASDHGLDSGTASNLIVGVFGPLALEDMIEAAKETEGHRGDPDPRMGPFNLYVPTVLEAYAGRVVGSNNLAGVGDNDTNKFLNTRISKIVASPYFTSTTFYAIRSANDDHGLFHVSRRGIRVKSEEIKSKDLMAYYCTEMYLDSFDDWRGFLYSSGTGA
jgi:hypothetical protein